MPALPTITSVLSTCVAAAFFSAAMALAAPVATTVENRSTTTLCAEEDNVSIALRAAGVRHMRISALQPDYLDRIDNAVTAPDFSGCNFDGAAHPTDPVHRFQARRVVLLDDARWRIVGLTLPTFWRPQRVPIHIGNHRERGVHLLQVFKKGNGKALEAIVLYPSDGYWRIKPLPEARFGDGVYGSSFLLGPVEQAGRPLVNIGSIRIVPAPLTLHLHFTDGSNAVVRVAEVSRRRTVLDVTLSRPSAYSQPFAMLRSMYVTSDNADMSEIRWLQSPTSAWQARSLPDVRTLEAIRVRLGRSVPSRHNTSAPDIEFSDFDDLSR